MAQLSREEIVATCERYWRNTRVPADAVAAMKRNLESQLAIAAAAGKKPQSVIGRDVIVYAEARASEFRLPPPPSADEAPRDRSREQLWEFFYAFGWIIPVTAIVILLIIFGPKEESILDGNVLWRWLWVGITVFLAVGEMVTAGFFMLPFAVGAAVAATLAWFDVTLPIQLVAFIGTSLVALWGIRRFAISDTQPSYPVGAKRFVNARAIVLTDVIRDTGQGKVRLDREEWRATTDGAEPISAGTEVRVVDVRGSRLVVEAVPDDL